MGWRWCSATARAGCAPSCSWRAAGDSTSWTPCSPSTCPSSGQWTTTIRSCSGNTGKTFPSSCPESCSPPRMAGKLSQGGKVTSSCVINCQSLVSQRNANPCQSQDASGGGRLLLQGELMVLDFTWAEWEFLLLPSYYLWTKGPWPLFYFPSFASCAQTADEGFSPEVTFQDAQVFNTFLPCPVCCFFSNRGSQVF